LTSIRPVITFGSSISSTDQTGEIEMSTESEVRRGIRDLIGSRGLN